MIKSVTLCIGAAILSTGSAFALPLIPSTIDIDFRGSPWAAANNLGTYTVGGVTAAAAPSVSVLRHVLDDGLGIDGPVLNRIEDPTEVGPLETLVVSFASPTSLVAAYLNDLYPFSLTSELIEDSGILELYSGSSLLATYQFNGTDSSGEKVVSFASPTLVTRVEFKVPGASAVDRLANRDFAVAGFDVADPVIVVPVSDSGVTLALLGGGWLCVGLLRRKSS